MPAFSIISILISGNFPGELRCAGRFAVVSSIRPMLAFTGFKYSSSSAVRIPAFVWGRRPVAMLFSHRAWQYCRMLSYPALCRMLLKPGSFSGCSPKVKRASVQPFSAPLIRIRSASPGCKIQCSVTGVRKQQYSHRLRQTVVSGRKTFFEKVITFLFMVKE